ncbi:hypothetical protein [Pelagicoccus sp. SDUM812005]|uniref:hypothetical protein n=1 Tax=Pelagicoccus sp. SDUM812005 TaxID=3041257 RepID=UPI00280DEEE8|nr:hypothetical protein [Pelagicoccus sp. SDUM812005]MDQ8182225.1 hypothetical protein [Pelagicoccus sp. SDUM812005]
MLSKKDNAKEALIKAFAQSIDMTDELASLPEYKFKSIGLGWVLKPDGSEFMDGEYSPFMATQRANLTHYLRLTDRGDGSGKLKWKKQRVKDPILKDTVTVSGLMDRILKALDKAGCNLAPVVRELAILVGTKWEEADPNARVLSVAVHANAGCLHFHPSHTRITEDNKLVNPATKRGNNRVARAGVALIALLRLRKQGYLPKRYADNLKGFLKKRSQKSGTLPPDYVVSCYVDRALDFAVWKLTKDSEYLKGVVRDANREYEEYIREKYEAQDLELGMMAEVDRMKEIRFFLKEADEVNATVKNTIETAEREKTYEEAYRRLVDRLQPFVDARLEKAKKLKKRLCEDARLKKEKIEREARDNKGPEFMPK